MRATGGHRSRLRHEDREFLGLAIGLMSGLAGMVSAYLGGKLADRQVAKNQWGVATQVTVCNFLAVPTYTAAMLIDTATVALALLTIPSSATA